MTTAAAPDAAERGALGRGDAALCALLGLGAIVYVALVPGELGRTDEAMYLYVSKRIAEGAAPYRDLFEIITPGFMWLMAAAFRVFGATMATANGATAVMHGLIAGLTYLAARLVGVRPAIATAAALAHPALFQPAWPYSSPHWLSTVLQLVVLVVLLRGSGRFACTVAGMATGAMIAVQQQRGVVCALGIVAIFLLAAPARGPRGVALGRFLVGMALVIVPAAAVVVLQAGFRAPFEALVVHPLVNYRGGGRMNRTSWGGVNVLSHRIAAYTAPRLLTWLPLAVAVPALQAAWGLGRGLPREPCHRSIVLAVLGATAVISIFYLPDFIHLAIVAPVVAVAAADAVELAVGALGGRGAGLVVSGLLLALLGRQLAMNAERRRTEFPVVHATAFGRVRFRSAQQAAFVDEVRDRLRRAGSDGLFCYPGYPAMYLLAGATNPTRFQLLGPGYNSPDEIAEALGALERTRLPYVVVVPLFVTEGDPVAAWLRQSYERVELPELEGAVGAVLLARRVE
ncbi:MAG TPA: hypothetical protein VGJ70_02755 [Solirubrobacteraceae bacterium]